MASSRDLPRSAGRRPGALLGALPRAASFALSWTACFILAVVAVSLPVAASRAGVPWWGVQLTLLAPAALTLTLLRQGRTWTTWAAIMLIAQMVYPEVLVLFLLAAFTCALHRAWFTDPLEWRFHRKSAPAPRRELSSSGGAK